MKKGLSFFMVVVIALSSLCGITVCGAEMRYAYTVSASSRLSISNQKATCIGIAVGDNTVTKITAVQYLEKKSGSKWYSVNDEPWSASSSNNTLTFSNSQSSLSSGTYRVKTVFTVYSGSDSEKSYCDQQGSNDLTQIFSQGRPRQMRCVSVSGLSH